MYTLSVKRPLLVFWVTAHVCVLPIMCQELEDVLSVKDTDTMARLLEIVVILWRSIQKSLLRNKDVMDYLVAKFATVLPEYLRFFQVLNGAELCVVCVREGDREREREKTYPHGVGELFRCQAEVIMMGLQPPTLALQDLPFNALLCGNKKNGQARGGGGLCMGVALRGSGVRVRYCGGQRAAVLGGSECGGTQGSECGVLVLTNTVGLGRRSPRPSSRPRPGLMRRGCSTPPPVVAVATTPRSGRARRSGPCCWERMLSSTCFITESSWGTEQHIWTSGHKSTELGRLPYA